MKLLAASAVLLATAAPALAQINAGEMKSDTNVPFTMTQVATLRYPWKIAFLPDGRMLITEKVGGVVLMNEKGEYKPVSNVPPVLYKGQGGQLGIFLSPHYAQDKTVYLTYSEPGEPGGSSLALAKAKLAITGDTASLEDVKVIWRDGERGQGGQFGAAVAFAPDGKSLFPHLG